MTLKQFLKKIKLSERAISAILGVLVVVVAGILLFNFFQSRGEVEISQGEILDGQEQMAANLSQNQDLPKTHRVLNGENLWEIAESYYGSGYNWVDIAEENNLADANILLVDQELIIPDVAIRLPDDDLVGTKGSQVNNYTVQSGDSLWKIAVAIYGDGYQWTNIYQANEVLIGTNPGMIYAGTVLIMP
jgi:nucleoid-associated protein YgaU